MATTQSFAELLRQYEPQYVSGQIVKGTIIEIRPKKEVLVDIGGKSEGVVSASEFEDFDTVKLGDVINVLIEKAEDKEGNIHLSKEKAEFQQNWDRIRTICNEGGTVMGKVKGVVKFGNDAISRWGACPSFADPEEIYASILTVDEKRA